jgi:hypothetical protein
MCNCGKKRSSLNTTARSAVAPVQNQQPIAARPQPSLAHTDQSIMFQYTGSTALSIIGRVTRKSYRFNFPGDIKPVAIVDATDMKTVPVLKMVE